MDHEFVLFFEVVTKLEIPSEIKPPLFAATFSQQHKMDQKFSWQAKAQVEPDSCIFSIGIWLKNSFIKGSTDDKFLVLSIRELDFLFVNCFNLANLPQDLNDQSFPLEKKNSVRVFDFVLAPGGVRHFHCGAYGQKRNFSGAQYTSRSVYQSTTLYRTGSAQLQ